MNKRILRILIGLTASVAVLLFSLYGRYQAETQSKQSKTETEYVKVVEVNDGDTISVIFGGRKERVRLIGIDAPELQQRPWGQRAKKHLRELLSTSQWTVSIEFDIEKRDVHGRLLSYVWTSDGRMVNVQMLKDGYAMLYTFPPNIRYVDEFKKAQDEARSKSLGIWERGGIKETPREYRKEHPRL
jgi:micrococcal nuclease